MRALVFAVLLLALAGCKDESSTQQTTAQPSMPVKVAAPMRETITEWEEYTGRFEASARVDIRARVGGSLESIAFKDGQDVKKGDVLFIIDPRPYRIALERAEAAFELASKEYERAKTLRTTSAGSDVSVDRAFQKYRDARAAVDDARLNLGFTTVRAPMDGRLGRTQVDVGNLITGSNRDATLLTTLVAIKPIYFYFEASENQSPFFMKHGSTSIHVRARIQDETEFTHEGTIDFIDNAVNKDTGTLQVRAVFSNSDGGFVPGMFGRLRVAQTEPHDALLVPDDVIGTNQTQKFVYVVAQDNTIDVRPVVLGPLHNKTWRVVREGLADTDKVVISGLTVLQPGAHVTPTEATP